MKQLNFLAMSLAIGALSACSDKDDFTTGSETHDAGAYISVALNLPTTSGSSTRAENDNFDDGDTNEYAVNDLSLLLFAGSDEASATFLNVYNIDKSEWTKNETNTQITTHYSFVKQIDGYSGNLYALAVLNKNGLDLSRSSLSGKKLSDLQAWIVDSSDGSADEFTSDGFFMTNSPLSSVAGGSGDTGELTVLAKVGDTFNTEDDANKSIEEGGTPSFNIYVERGVAKVEVRREKTSDTVTSEDGINGYTYTVTSWCLDITNTQSYLVRNTSNKWNKYISNAFSNSSDNTKYRFLGTQAVSDGGEYYRNYWAIDPNYSSEDSYGVAGEENSDFACIYGTNGEPKMLNPGTVDYCFENTFDVKHQNQNETTRVIIGVQLKNGEDAATFYTKGSDKNTIYTEATVSEDVAAAAVGNTEVLSKLDTYISSGTISSEDVEVTISDGTVSSAVFKNNEPDGLSYNSSYSWSDITSDESLKSALLTAAQAALKSYSCYEGGMAYYPVRIKHFGDDLTPWNDNEYDGTTYYPQPISDNIYPGDYAAEQYLGRYGVVRNNWYVIEVTGVSGLGYADPTKVEISSSPDDELPEYISAKINILSWAVRTQEAVLK